ncbi:uncharacterized protein plaat1l isoform X1 [Cyclopterus lumpus]|uniref:uncharacterized protein plaat1l isoform X1 n=1 Tax=Cyclopterus lumpus TaxID=8103 RepID=UPI001485E66D|nr:uncharacterized protein plaat1l isoform X1 [Cyclopterus lumpus]
MGLKLSRPPQLFPGDIVEYPRNKYFSHFAVYYGERDGVPYVAHLTSRDSDSKLPLFGRALRSEVKLDPLELLGRKYKVNNMLDDSFSARDFHGVVKPAIDDLMGREVTFDILFHNSEHQATLLRSRQSMNTSCRPGRSCLRRRSCEHCFVCTSHSDHKRATLFSWHREGYEIKNNAMFVYVLFFKTFQLISHFL